MKIRYTKFGGNTYIDRTEKLSEWGDHVAENVGNSRYISAAKPLSCFSYVVKEGLHTFTNPSTCILCKKFALCSFGALQERQECEPTKESEEVRVKLLGLKDPIDMDKLIKEGTLLDYKLLGSTPAEFDWTKGTE